MCHTKYLYNGVDLLVKEGVIALAVGLMAIDAEAVQWWDELVDYAYFVFAMRFSHTGLTQESAELTAFLQADVLHLLVIMGLSSATLATRLAHLFGIG